MNVCVCGYCRYAGPDIRCDYTNQYANIDNFAEFAIIFCFADSVQSYSIHIYNTTIFFDIDVLGNIAKKRKKDVLVLES